MTSYKLSLNSTSITSYLTLLTLETPQVEITTLISTEKNWRGIMLGS